MEEGTILRVSFEDETKENNKRRGKEIRLSDKTADAMAAASVLFLAPRLPGSSLNSFLLGAFRSFL